MDYSESYANQEQVGKFEVLTLDSKLSQSSQSAATNKIRWPNYQRKCDHNVRGKWSFENNCLVLLATRCILYPRKVHPSPIDLSLILHMWSDGCAGQFSRLRFVSNFYVNSPNSTQFPGTIAKVTTVKVPWMALVEPLRRITLLKFNFFL